MINLNNTTLVAIGSTRIKETLKAIDICHKYCNFYDTIFFTDAETPYTFRIPRMDSIKAYDQFVVKNLPKLIDADYTLTIHWDGFIVNPEAWTDQFLEYDYVGAPWPWWDHICGNGGFCLKSRKFFETQMELFDESYFVNDPDDVELCVKNREKFIKHGCIYAPPNIAYQFATEYGGYDNYHSFGFHDLRINTNFKEYLL